MSNDLEEYFANNDWCWGVGFNLDESNNTRKVYVRRFEDKPMELTVMGKKNNLIEVRLVCLKNLVKTMIYFDNITELDNFVQIFD